MGERGQKSLLKCVSILIKPFFEPTYLDILQSDFLLTLNYLKAFHVEQHRSTTETDSRDRKPKRHSNYFLMGHRDSIICWTEKSQKLTLKSTSKRLLISRSGIFLWSTKASLWSPSPLWLKRPPRPLPAPVKTRLSLRIMRRATAWRLCQVRITIWARSTLPHHSRDQCYKTLLQ